VAVGENDRYLNSRLFGVAIDEHAMRQFLKLFQKSELGKF
jgi:hypothetical protein